MIYWLTPKCTNVEPVLASLGDFTPFKPFYFDQHGSAGWELVREHVARDKPEIILYNGIAGGLFLPSIDTLKFLKERAKTVFLCFDAASKDWHSLIQEYIYFDVFDLIVNIDGNGDHPKSDKVITTLCPISPRFFAPKRIIERPIHAGFCGGDGSSSRRHAISTLGSILTVRTREETSGSYQAYADFLMQCRISFNMANAGPDDAKQVKARVIESALAGCALLEEKGAPTANYFEPMVDYIQYDSIDHAKELIWKLGTSVSVLQIYADRLREKVFLNHSPLKFWTLVFERLGTSLIA